MKWIEYQALGPDKISIRASNLYMRKGIFSWGKKHLPEFIQNIFRKNPRPENRPKVELKIGNSGGGEIHTDEIIPISDEFDDWLFKYVEQDWNPVFNEIGETGTFLGYLSGYLSGKLKLPVETVDSMGIEDFDRAFKYKLGVGLDDKEAIEYKLDSDRIQHFAENYSKNHSAEWIAVYERDENGNIIYENGQPKRGGKPYQYLKALWGAMVTDAVKTGKSIEELQSEMAFPDLYSLVESGKMTEDEYLQVLNGRESDLLTMRLNRNFKRFAFTESAMAFNAGAILAAKESGIEYMIFRRGARGI
ncbi:MAG: hypothetical protein HS129_04900 [Leptospiraceae bacterium]|nr:hypothetical protein [Leptospiraceae bacterium]